ncbi:hypothetical protein Clacol_008497 [Clathrus columnatus]|uniref:Uncharacterized protein n=1 Tax=Clathrus columnatus TaxID=1419009 RepID=A0AAV5AI01_9AGAM|nr:hypothetical protein Clacol_008497 [Clathrus columnatus]
MHMSDFDHDSGSIGDHNMWTTWGTSARVLQTGIKEEFTEFHVHPLLALREMRESRPEYT